MTYLRWGARSRWGRFVSAPPVGFGRPVQPRRVRRRAGTRPAARAWSRTSPASTGRGRVLGSRWSQQCTSTIVLAARHEDRLRDPSCTETTSTRPRAPEQLSASAALGRHAGCCASPSSRLDALQVVRRAEQVVRHHRHLRGPARATHGPWRARASSTRRMGSSSHRLDPCCDDRMADGAAAPVSAGLIRAWTSRPAAHRLRGGASTVARGSRRGGSWKAAMVPHSDPNGTSTRQLVTPTGGGSPRQRGLEHHPARPGRGPRRTHAGAGSRGAPSRGRPSAWVTLRHGP